MKAGFNKNRNVDGGIERAYENLANAIILQAVDDYREALEDNDIWLIEALENFFMGDLYAILTKVPGKLIIERIRREYGYEGKGF